MEEALEKSGPELFRELLRLYETVEYEDYFKAGKWKDDLMKTDLVLIAAHRKEAGAPDPPALEDVELPALPTAPSVTLGGLTSQAVGAAPAGGPVAELRLIALFVAKWKLDPTKAKASLSKLLPNRRRYVIQNFKATAQGDAGCAELENFIGECEKNGQWDKVAGPPVGVGAVRPPGVVPAVVSAIRAPSPGAFTPRPVGAGALTPVTSGIKRPVTPPTPAFDPSKRPRLGAPAVVPARPATAPVGGAPAPGALQARLAAARANATIASARPAAVVPRAPLGTRPVTPAIRPAGVRAPVAKPAAKPPGMLIKGLLNKF